MRFSIGSNRQAARGNGQIPRRSIARKAGFTTFLLVLTVIAYCAVVSIWAAASVDELVTKLPVPDRQIKLSMRQLEILLKVEDPTFFDHAGLSLANGQGLTTITSSVARDVFLFGRDLEGAKGVFQSLFRRAHTCCKKIDLGRDVMALVLNVNLPKEKQLSLYVANVYMGTNNGRQIIGLDSAALSYFGKQLNQLSENEYIGLVAMIKAPNHFHPSRNRQAFELRTARIESLLAEKCEMAGWFDTDYSRCPVRK